CPNRVMIRPQSYANYVRFPAKHRLDRAAGRSAVAAQRAAGRASNVSEVNTRYEGLFRASQHAARRRATLLLGVSIVVFAVFRIFLSHATYSDLKIYRIEGFAVRNGWDLYGHLPGMQGFATYPPFAAVAFILATPLSVVTLEVLYVAATIALLVWASIACCRLAGATGEGMVTAGCVLAALSIWSEPVYRTLGFGQINVLLLALVIWDFTRAPDSRWRGVGVGLAAALKVTPGIFILYLLLTRRYRFAVTAMVTFAVTFGLSAAIEPRATWRYWTDYLLDPHRVGRLENALNPTMRGLLVSVDHTRDTPHAQLLIILAVLVFGLAAAVYAERVVGDRWGLPACAITGLLTSPISWSHHWVWVVPVVALLWYHARVWLIPTVAIFWSFAVWDVPNTNELHFSALQIALSEWYVIWGLGF